MVVLIRQRYGRAALEYSEQSYGGLVQRGVKERSGSGRRIKEHITDTRRFELRDEKRASRALHVPRGRGSGRWICGSIVRGRGKKWGKRLRHGVCGSGGDSKSS